MNVLVTGADGQLGKTVAKLAEGCGNNYIFCDVSELDITDESSVEACVLQNDIDVILNCAAYTNVDKAEDSPELADAVNHTAVAGMARIAKKHDVVLIHISTDYVFDGRNGVPYDDDAAAFPLNVYGRTKADAEKAIVESGCRYLIFRTSWLYSVEGSNFVKTIAEKSAEQTALKVVCDQIGSPTFADDLAGMILHVIEEDMLDRTGIYNYTDEGVCSWYDFAHEICLQSGNLCEVLPCMTYEYPRKAARPHYSVLDKSKVKKTFGVDIPHWKDSLTICMNTLKKI